MGDVRPLLQTYSPARSAWKGASAVAQLAVSAVVTLAIALAGDPELVARVTALAAGHPWALGAIGTLVFAGRFLADWRKHR